MSVCFFCLLRKVARVIAGASDDESDNEPVQSNGPTKAQDHHFPATERLDRERDEKVRRGSYRFLLRTRIVFF